MIIEVYEDAGYQQAIAAEGMVLCNGTVRTSVRTDGHGGTVTAPLSTDISAWAEMDEAAADALVAENQPEKPEEDATEADYQAALTELGVDLNEEE